MLKKICILILAILAVTITTGCAPSQGAQTPAQTPNGGNAAQATQVKPMGAPKNQAAQSIIVGGENLVISGDFTIGKIRQIESPGFASVITLVVSNKDKSVMDAGKDYSDLDWISDGVRVSFVDRTPQVIIGVRNLLPDGEPLWLNENVAWPSYIFTIKSFDATGSVLETESIIIGALSSGRFYARGIDLSRQAVRFEVILVKKNK